MATLRPESVPLRSRASGALAEEPWDRDAAARYLNARAAEWTTFPRERQKLTTSCISRHTAMPYLLARPALRGSSLPEPARTLFSDVETRVQGLERREGLV